MSSVSRNPDGWVDRQGAVKRLHPEDILVGDDVAVADVVREFPSFFWCGSDSMVHPREELVRLRFQGDETFKVWSVKNVCLPFVLVENEDRQGRVLDVRLVQLVKLDPQFARDARKVAARVRKRRARKKRKA
jgi:hypothetical protein